MSKQPRHPRARRPANTAPADPSALILMASLMTWPANCASTTRGRVTKTARVACHTPSQVVRDVTRSLLDHCTVTGIGVAVLGEDEPTLSVHGQRANGAQRRVRIAIPRDQVMRFLAYVLGERAPLMVASCHYDATDDGGGEGLPVPTVPASLVELMTAGRAQ